MARLHAQCHPGGKAEMAVGDTDLLTAHLGVPAEGDGTVNRGYLHRARDHLPGPLVTQVHSQSP